MVEERKVDGMIERVYALPPGGAMLSGEALAEATREDHERHFTAFASSLLAESPVTRRASGSTRRPTASATSRWCCTWTTRSSPEASPGSSGR